MHVNSVGSYQDLVGVVASKKGHILSSAETYKGASKPMRVACSKGHEWDTTLYRVSKLNNWCLICSAESRKIILNSEGKIKCDLAAVEKGGQCLSLLYQGVDQRLEWSCANIGHPSWQATPSSIFNGSWCLACYVEGQPENAQIARFHPVKKKVSRGGVVGRPFQYRLDDVVMLADGKKGECLSKEYVGWHKHHEFKCEQGHQWMAIPSKVKKGSWCPKCARLKSRKYEWKDLQAWAQKRGGSCLSDSFEGTYIKHLWKCHDENHPSWLATPSAIMSKKWCPYCGKSNATSKQYEALAKSRGGEMIGQYVDTLTSIQWRCAKKHVFEKAPERVKQGRWCPTCWGKGEQLVRTSLERIFGVSLPVSRPAWLKEKPGDSSEVGWSLDGLNEPLRLAFEYQGVLHLKFNGHFHDDIEDLERIQARDKRKIEMCRDKNIVLLVINQLSKISQENAWQAICEELNTKKRYLGREAKKRFNHWKKINGMK